MKVRSFVSFSQSGWEDLVKLHGLLALSNLQLRGQSLSPTPVLYAGDMTVLSTNPREVHLQESLSQLRDALQVQITVYIIIIYNIIMGYWKGYQSCLTARSLHVTLNVQRYACISDSKLEMIKSMV